MTDYVRDLAAVDATQLASVGGKGAQLGELARLEGVRVPGGFCVTTDAYQRFVATVPGLATRLDELADVPATDRDGLRRHSEALRATLESFPVPEDVAAAVLGALAELGGEGYAVRSSATAEDLPTASFAGQQDTYLNVVGGAAVLHHVRACWASLFTERAVAYRQRRGIDHRRVRMGVVVQHMVAARAAGVLFTADPLSGDRTLASLEAVPGLGEALVAGSVEPDAYAVRDDRIQTRSVATKARALQARRGGGVAEQEVEPARRDEPVLDDAQVLELVRAGRRIEAHFGRPQDIEWCLADDGFRFVQSRPITTLFPIPEADDDRRHVYVSVGHQQMMTDAMAPLGLSLFQLTAGPPMHEAGSRLFVDVTQALVSPTLRAGLLRALGTSDPLVGDALQQLVERDGFLPSAQDEDLPAAPAGTGPATEVPDPAVVAEVIDRTEASLATLATELRGRSGTDLVDFVLADVAELKRILFDPSSHQAIMAGMEATWWLNAHLLEWLGEQHVADTLTRSVTDNVTSEMGLALLDVADTIRPHPEVIAYLEGVEDDDFLERLPAFAGGVEVRDALVGFLERYGMRCVAEIDITRPRWSEEPRTLVPSILANVRNLEPGEAGRRVERGRREASAKEAEVLARLRALPDGEQKAADTQQRIATLRAFTGFREYPKYGIVRRYACYKAALWDEARRLVDEGVLGEPDDIAFLTFPELREVVATRQVDRHLVERRRQAHRADQALTPPRVLTSDGEIVTGAHRRDDVPDGALAGLAVSTGTVEGRARVVLDLADAELDPGDILVTVYTDPSWSALFVAVAGLVTEVGGLMTHGAVIAREYGLPAVVGVVGATEQIRDGQRIRVYGTDGYVELLD